MTREIRSRSVALLATGLLLGGVVGSSSAMASTTLVSNRGSACINESEMVAEAIPTS